MGRVSFRLTIYIYIYIYTHTHTHTNHIYCLFVCVCVPQCVLREGLEEMKQFFSVNSSCRLPLNPALLVTGINIQVRTHIHTHAHIRTHTHQLLLVSDLKQKII